MKNKKIYFMVTPEHANLGDHMLALSCYQIFEKAGLSKNITEISFNEYTEDRNLILKQIKKDDIIIILGGGNLGTLWPKVDTVISDIIHVWRDNKIIVFPNTVYYGNDTKSKNRMIINNEIYSNAKDLTVFLREVNSLAFFKKNFPKVNSILAPDTALFVKPNKFLNPNKIVKREGVLFCFRDDLERIYSCEDEISMYLNSKQILNKKTSTMHHRFIKRFERNEILDEKLEEFSRASLIITDRLHAMIFAFITGTPCIALDNISRKVSGVYEMIKSCNNIKICNNVDEVISNIEKYYNRISLENDRIYLDFDSIFNELSKID